MSKSKTKVGVIGAGVGGLAAAIDLARAGCEVDLFERAAQPGGKIRQVGVNGVDLDAGPTVFTMRWVFDELFEGAGSNLSEELNLSRTSILARHAWTGGGRLDLYEDIDESIEAIRKFSDGKNADGYKAFCMRSKELYLALKDTFIAAEKPSPLGLVSRVGLAPFFGAMWETSPHRDLWRALDRYFSDPRLKQLFGRYSTYVGSSPLATPSILMLIAHVEQDGVWLLDGGMHSLAKALRNLGENLGVRYHFNAHVDRINCDQGKVTGLTVDEAEVSGLDAIVFNGDRSALATGLLGEQVADAVPLVKPSRRGLSAIIWCVRARTSGLPLSYHNVFFAEDYPKEFRHIFQKREIVESPTVYVCAQDRLPDKNPDGSERLLILINAPADGDTVDITSGREDFYWNKATTVLRDCGLRLELDPMDRVMMSPATFSDLYPGTGGSLYGQASHGIFSPFLRPGSASPVDGLFLAGGSVHPGPGIPMATLSGRLAASALLKRFSQKG